MSDRTGIQWTDATWNPVRGCSRVSPGCQNCYAEMIAARFSGKAFKGFAEWRSNGEPKWTGKLALVEKALTQPLKWRAPRRIFVNSMSDLFHENLSEQDIIRVFSIMQRAERHTFQILTKRPARMLDVVRRIMHPEPPLPNVWLGVSVESQEYADERIPLLLQTPAAVRFVSYEPALGPVDFSAFTERHYFCCDSKPGLDWIIIGGESGKGARPFDVAWARSTVRQCRDAGVACFVKQLGAQPVIAADQWDSLINVKLRDSHGGYMAEWPEDLRVREFPHQAVTA